MTDPLRTSKDRSFSDLENKVRLLMGETGDGSRRAVLARDLGGLTGALSSIKKETGSLSASLNSNKKTIAEILAEIGKFLDETSVDTTELGESVEALENQVAAINDGLTQARQTQVTPMIARAAAGTAPTAAEFNKVVTDLNVLRDAILLLASRLPG